MKRISKSFIVTLLTFAAVFFIIPSFAFKSKAAGEVGIGTTWYVGDVIDAGDAWFDIDHTEPNIYIDRIIPGSVLPAPEFLSLYGGDGWIFSDFVVYYNCFVAYGSVDKEPVGITIVSGSGTDSDPFQFEFVYEKPSDSDDSATEEWLDPLRTELNIAADPEFGGNVNHTAEYTGDFALPKEIMQFLKDHPDTTLVYTYMKDELTPITVTIPGKAVMIEEGVDWYGIDYLLQHFSANAKITGAAGDYVIVKGDTLTSIAAKFGTTVEALLAKNAKITNRDLIYAGDSLVTK